MTVVAQILFNETSLLIGDSLISGREQDREIFIPTIGSIYEVLPEGSGWSVTGLKKKINIVGSNVVIGWYGNFYAASCLIEGLRAKSQSSPLSIDDINAFFTTENIKSQVGSYVIEDSKPVGFIGSVYCEGVLHNFEFFTGSRNPVINISLPQSGGVIKICGSGAEDFRDYLSSISLEKIERQICQSKDPSDTIHRLYLYISSYFLTKEILNPSDEGTIVPSYYGGYYDFAAISDGQLVDRKEHTYFFWEVVPDTSGKPEAKLCVQGLKTYYLDKNVTLCLSYSTSKSDKKSALQAKVEATLHYISPVDMRKDELKSLVPSLKINELEFNSEYSCHFCLIRDAHNSLMANQFITLIIQGEQCSANHPVKIENKGTGLQYSSNQEFAKFLENTAFNMWTQK